MRFLFTGLMLKILILLALIGTLYYFHIWPFRQNVASVEFQENKYCEQEDPEKTAICNCIVQPLRADIDRRFNKAEQDSMLTDRLKGAYVLEKSLQVIKPSAQACLKEKGFPEGWAHFTDNLASLDNKYLKMAAEKLRSGADYLKEQWKSRTGEKKEIDEKY